MISNRRSFLTGGLAAFLSASGRAYGSSEAAVAHAKALTGASFQTDRDVFVLADILAPTPDAPGGAAAQEALQALLSSDRILISELGRDRWGRGIGRLTQSLEQKLEQKSVELDLMAQGVVRTAPQTDDYAFLVKLLEAEDAARADARGLWATPAYRVYDAASGYVPFDEYHLFKGVIKSAAERSGRLFFNFGEDYRTDVTASAPLRRVRSWTVSKKGPASAFWALVATGAENMVGQKVLARGHVARLNGPSVDISHPLQIELLG